MFVSINYLSGT